MVVVLRADRRRPMAIFRSLRSPRQAACLGLSCSVKILNKTSGNPSARFGENTQTCDQGDPMIRRSIDSTFQSLSPRDRFREVAQKARTAAQAQAEELVRDVKARLPLHWPPWDVFESNDATDPMTHVKEFASDAMAGRRGGTEGFNRACRYVADSRRSTASLALRVKRIRITSHSLSAPVAPRFRTSLARLRAQDRTRMKSLWCWPIWITWARAAKGFSVARTTTLQAAGP